jgi:hypothetical protein
VLRKSGLQIAIRNEGFSDMASWIRLSQMAMGKFWQHHPSKSWSAREFGFNFWSARGMLTQYSIAIPSNIVSHNSGSLVEIHTRHRPSFCQAMPLWYPKFDPKPKERQGESRLRPKKLFFLGFIITHWSCWSTYGHRTSTQRIKMQNVIKNRRTWEIKSENWYLSFGRMWL